MKELITPIKAAALLANPGEGIEECLERVEKQLTTAVQMIKAVADAIRELEEVPNGVLHAHLIGTLDFNTYSTIIDRLKATGLVVERNNVLVWVEPRTLRISPDPYPNATVE